MEQSSWLMIDWTPWPAFFCTSTWFAPAENVWRDPILVAGHAEVDGLWGFTSS